MTWEGGKDTGTQNIIQPVDVVIEDLDGGIDTGTQNIIQPVDVVIEDMGRYRYRNTKHNSTSRCCYRRYGREV